jgi:hypothetical protein
LLTAPAWGVVYDKNTPIGGEIPAAKKQQNEQGSGEARYILWLATLIWHSAFDDGLMYFYCALGNTSRASQIPVCYALL